MKIVICWRWLKRKDDCDNLMKLIFSVGYIYIKINIIKTIFIFMQQEGLAALVFGATGATGMVIIV